MVKAGNAVWLVRKISVLSFSASRKQMRRVVLAGAGVVQCDGLIRDHAPAPVGGRGINPMGIQIGLGTRDEEGTTLVQRMQAGEVDIPAIHDVNGAGFGDQHIKSMNIRPSNELPKSHMSHKLPAKVGSANRTLVMAGN
jgi:hypothetical protein